MKRLLYIAPALLAGQFIPGAGFWGPVVLLVGLIFFHELGHFLVAKWMRMPVEVFSLGFGPRVAGFAWNETDVRLSLLPLGGYVRLAGYNPEEPDAQDPNGFLAQPAWKRLFFYSGGIIANILITVVIFCGMGVNQARITNQHAVAAPLQVDEVTPGSAAAEAGLQPGDKIRSFGELAFPGNKSEDAIAYIQARPGASIPVTLEREGVTRTLQVVPKSEGGKGKLGIYFEVSTWIYDRRPFQFGDLGRGARFGVVNSAKLGWEILGNFGKLITHKVSLKEVGGPITIVRAGSRAAKAGLAEFLFLTALISMNLAVLNALPIPFLDGGHAAILVVERIRGRDLSILVKERILQGGFFFLASLMAMVIALERGEQPLLGQALERLWTNLAICSELNMLPQWWAHRIAIHLLSDLWSITYHEKVPFQPAGGEAVDWPRLRELFIALLHRRTKAEVDLWPSQIEAASRAVDQSDDLVVSLPTSAGKTRIAELCILRCLAGRKRVVFITPLRALSAQTETTLRGTFGPLGKTISALYGSIGVSGFDENAIRERDIVVATPEKLDFALRNDPSLLDDVGLLVFDEGHMIGLNEREVRYEVQIQRLLRRADASDRRIVCLSAILPDGDQMDDFAGWLRRDHPGGPIKHDWRPTRLRFGEVVWSAPYARLDQVNHGGH